LALGLNLGIALGIAPAIVPGIAPAIALGITVWAVAGARPAAAEDYRAAIDKLLAEHQRMKGAEADLRGAESGASRARSGWYPTATLLAKSGRSNIRSTTSRESETAERELSITARQPLWDFGKISAEIKKAELDVAKATNGLSQTEQDLLLEGVSAYIGLYRTALELGFAKQSVTNIQRQTGLEESRVQLGGGVGSDVLQAKSQLAGAEARLARAEGALIAADNRFRALFERKPTAHDRKQTVAVPTATLPKTLDAAVSLARTHNRRLAVAQLTAESARAELARVRGDKLYPDINAVAKLRRLHNPSGVKGERTEGLIEIEVSYPFNTGLEAFHASDAAREATLSATSKEADTINLVEEQVRNAWQSLETARRNADHLDNQARIVAEFLSLAREERTQGKRSLIDILSGETALINARSDAATATAEITLAAYSLLKATGQLERGVLK